jgi:oligopeptide/dipeptide ABC transporter ATP-binding protein
VIRLLKPTAGSIYFDVPSDVSEEIDKLEKDGGDSKELKRLKKQYDLAKFGRSQSKKMRKRLQIVYQDPTSSLNPRMLVKDIVGEPLIVQKLAKGHEVLEKTVNILHRVGLTESHLYRYPHEFSGGQRQRIAVARALVVNPDFVILDEPTSSVDVSVRAQLLNLFQSLQKEFDLTYMFISHDLSVVECISNRVAVMYLGKIVEIAKTAKIYKSPLHPYTQALFSSIPIPDPTAKRKRIALSGDVPSPINPPRGCRFHTRCPKAMAVCSQEEPELIDVGNGHLVACHLANM